MKWLNSQEKEDPLIICGSKLNQAQEARQEKARELTHILYDRLSENEKREINKISQWEINKAGIYVTSKNLFSEKDGANDPDEDFANNVEHYLYNTDNFKKSFLPISVWLDHFFRKINTK